MPAAKLVVIYPVPTDLEQFERRYLEHRVPMKPCQNRVDRPHIWLACRREPLGW
jgi:hypothetical protein